MLDALGIGSQVGSVSKWLFDDKYTGGCIFFDALKMCG